MKKTYFYLTFALIFFAVTLGGYAVWYYELGALSSSVSDITAEVTARNQGAAQALVAEDELTKLSAQESAIRNYFVSSSDIVSFLEGLQTVGTQFKSKVSIVSVEANPLPRQHLNLSLHISGSFDAVMRTVGAIENSPHDVSMLTLTVSATNPTASSTSWDAVTTLEVGTASSTPSRPGGTATTSVSTTTP